MNLLDDDGIVVGDAMNGGDDRYERRLVEETAKLRVEAAGMEVRLTDRIGQAEGTLRQEMGGLEVRLVDRIAQAESGIRQEMGGLRLEMGHLEVRLLKWSFAFWIGQVAAITGVLSVLLR